MSKAATSEMKLCYCAILNGGHNPQDCKAFETMCEALRGLRDWCDNNLNGCPLSLDVAMTLADKALLLADKVSK